MGASGPLAPLFLPEIRGNSQVWRELVVHFLDWTTGSLVFAGNQGNSPVWSELVVHLPEWSTGSSVFAGNQGNSPVWWELVAHFPEWTTGSFDCMEKTTIIAGGFLHTKSQQDWLAG